jgi:hypothetical protein
LREETFGGRGPLSVPFRYPDAGASFSVDDSQFVRGDLRQTRRRFIAHEMPLLIADVCTKLWRLDNVSVSNFNFYLEAFESTAYILFNPLHAFEDNRISSHQPTY